MALTLRGLRAGLSDVATLLIAVGALATAFRATRRPTPALPVPARRSQVPEWDELRRVALWPPSDTVRGAYSPVALAFVEPGCKACIAGIRILDSLTRIRGVRPQLGYLLFPRPSTFPGAFAAAVGAECASRTGHLQDYLDAMLAAGDSLDLVRRTAELHISRRQLSACANELAAVRVVERHLMAGRALGIQTGGVLLVGGVLVRTPIVATAIDSVLELLPNVAVR